MHGTGKGRMHMTRQCAAIKHAPHKRLTCSKGAVPRRIAGGAVVVRRWVGSRIRPHIPVSGVSTRVGPVGSWPTVAHRLAGVLDGDVGEQQLRAECSAASVPKEEGFGCRVKPGSWYRCAGRNNTAAALQAPVSQPGHHTLLIHHIQLLPGSCHPPAQHRRPTCASPAIHCAPGGSLQKH